MRQSGRPGHLLTAVVPRLRPLPVHVLLLLLVWQPEAATGCRLHFKLVSHIKRAYYRVVHSMLLILLGVYLSER